MTAVIRLYDVEPRVEHPVLPLWAVEERGFPVEDVPHIGDELKVSEWRESKLPDGQPLRGETHYWRVIRRTQDLHPQAQIVILGLRFIRDPS